jgi:hypothetical protein
VKLDNWATTADLNGIYADVRALGLEQNIAEHDAFGFTIVPPDKVAPPEFQDRLRQALLNVHERRTGQRIHPEDLDTADLLPAIGQKPASASWHLLGEDRAFEEALMNPVVHTLARYFLGKSCVVSDFIGSMKQADPTPTHRLHTDQHGTPPPLPQYAQFLNITWALTDYTRDNGALAIVPGSHRFGYRPNVYEQDHLKNDALVPAIPVECPAGSLIIWGGTTWHASYPRTAPGVRMSVLMLFVRSYMKPIQDVLKHVPPEVLERNNKEFARLLGKNSAYPVGDELNIEDTLAFVNSGRTPWS